jgi:hypothetical protein
MALDLENYETFSEAIEGLPKVVELIASLPEAERSAALAAARQSYQQTAQALGYEESEAKHWVSAIMFQLKRRSALLSAQSREPQRVQDRT